MKLVMKGVILIFLLSTFEIQNWYPAYSDCIYEWNWTCWMDPKESFHRQKTLPLAQGWGGGRVSFLRIPLSYCWGEEGGNTKEGTALGDWENPAPLGLGSKIVGQSSAHFPPHSAAPSQAPPIPSAFTHKRAAQNLLWVFLL